MAIYTKKEIAEILGIKTNTLSIYVGRDKIFLENDSINSENPKNAAFIKKFLDKKAGKLGDKTVTVNESSKKTDIILNEKPVELGKSDKKTLSQYELDREKKYADLLLVEVNTRIANLKEKKLIGDLMPLELCKSLIQVQSESIRQAFIESCENMIVVISQKKQLTNIEIVDIREKITMSINKSIDAAINFSKRKIKAISLEYSGVKVKENKTEEENEL